MVLIMANILQGKNHHGIFPCHNLFVRLDTKGSGNIKTTIDVVTLPPR